MPILIFFVSLYLGPLFAIETPSRYLELLDYVQEAPDQGETTTCLFVASTGAMELIANKKNGITHPVPYGKFDLAESFLMSAPVVESQGKSLWEIPVLKFNKGFGIHIEDWPFDAWTENGGTNMSVWNQRDFSGLPKVSLPSVTTIPLFIKGNKWSTNVLSEEEILKIKEALWTHKAPVLVNYNDNRYWHVVLIVGYDDHIPGTCYQISDKECGKQKGAFFVRDSFGRVVELRDYDWFRVKGNAAFVVKEKE